MGSSGVDAIARASMMSAFGQPFDARGPLLLGLSGLSCRTPARSRPSDLGAAQPFLITLSAFLSILVSSAFDIRPAFTAWLARAFAFLA